jgi:RluA family pseudouridine synthase
MIIHKYLVVHPNDDNKRLDIFLSRRYPHLSRVHWQKKIRFGRVTIDGQKATPSQKIRTGQKIKYSYTQKTEPPVDTGYQILYRDDAFMVIDKPANLPVQPSGIYLQNNLSNLLKKEFPGGQKIRMINRIDRETSGLLLVGCTREVSKKLQKLFISKKIIKEYIVLVEGDFESYVDARGYLTDDISSPVRKKVKFVPIINNDDGVFPDDAAFVRTEFFKLESGNGLSLLKSILHTGKMHQIRATLCSMGYPVVGDKIYGVDDTIFLSFIDGRLSLDHQKLLRLDRTALHSYKLTFPHPLNNRVFSIESPAPNEFFDLLK